MSSIYDPIGLLAPVVLVAKIILQDILRLQTEWDEKLPLDIVTRWRVWTEEFPTLDILFVRRRQLQLPQACYRSLQLPVCSDASTAGFGAAVYIRTESGKGIEVTLVIAKARLAPIHQISVPKLELQGALLALRLIAYCLKEMTILISCVFFWVDATTVLKWIHSSHRKFTAFVANGVSEILETTTPDQWRHIPGEMNPTDHCSRGIQPADLNTEHRCFRGPLFL